MIVQIFKPMIGSVITSIDRTHDTLQFNCNDGRSFKFLHYHSCCEDVYIEDIAGDLEDLCGAPLTMAEEVSNLGAFNPPVPECRDYSYTWTFYRFGTNRGSVTVRWFGTSNGFYSESVDFEINDPSTRNENDE